LEFGLFAVAPLERQRLMGPAALRAGSARAARRFHSHQTASRRCQAIGRTKGGLNSKVTALVESYGRAVAVSLHPGPRNDVRTMNEHVCLLRGRTRVAEKAFDADGLRERIQRIGGIMCIPRRAKCNGTRPFRRRLYRLQASGRKLLLPDQTSSPHQHSLRKARLHLLCIRSAVHRPRLAQKLILHTPLSVSPNQARAPDEACDAECSRPQAGLGAHRPLGRIESERRRRCARRRCRR
jgi:hypothetical protein